MDEMIRMRMERRRKDGEEDESRAERKGWKMERGRWKE